MKKLFEIKDLKQYFHIGHNMFGSITSTVKAVDGVTFDIYEGETLGLVGETGCGKTTLGRSILQLYKPTSGKIFYKGEDITGDKFKPEYRKVMQYIFQDPYASLNPRMTVADIVGEPLDIHHLCSSKNERNDRIIEILNTVGLNSEHSCRYPHEFSGGQRQRIGIARALAVQPEFIVCDEPVSALDVSIRAQILNMLIDMQDKFNLTYLFISHDLAVIRHISDRVGVMYLGKMVELTDSESLFDNPIHPYSRALISAIPLLDPDETQKKKRIILQGEIPSPMNPPSGCKFRTRCSYAQLICAEKEPEFNEYESGHFCACHFAGRI